MTVLPRTDVQQRLWPAELLAALGRRSEPPFARRDAGAWRLHVPGEPSATGERAAARGGPAVPLVPQLFYETSSYGPQAVALMRRTVGAGQLVHGSDVPVLRGTIPQDDEALLRANPARLLG